MKKMTAFLVTLCMLAALLAGCGGASKSTQAFDAAAPAAAAPAGAANGAYYDMESAKSEDGGLTGDTDSTVLPEGRKWIITVNMSAETEDLDALMEALNGKISGLGGYVEDQDSYNGSMYSSRRYRSASLTVRIPAERVDEFTEEMSGIANVVSTNLSREDITLSYVATESRVKALQTEEARLLELMEQAVYELMEIFRVSEEAETAQKNSNEKVYRESAIRKQIEFLQQQLDEMHPENISDVRRFQKKIKRRACRIDIHGHAGKPQQILNHAGNRRGNALPADACRQNQVDFLRRYATVFQSSPCSLGTHIRRRFICADMAFLYADPLGNPFVIGL